MKFHKIISIVALSAIILGGLGASGASVYSQYTNPTQASAKRIHRHAHHRYHHAKYIRNHHEHAKWSKGNAKFLGHNHEWKSSIFRNNIGNSKMYPYMSITSPLGKNVGFNPTPQFYNYHKKSINSGADGGAYMAINPYKQYIGHNEFRVISGNNSLKKDLESETKGDMWQVDHNVNSTSDVIIKVHNHNHITVYNHVKGNLYKFFGNYTK